MSGNWIREHRQEETPLKLQLGNAFSNLLRGQACRIIALFLVLSVTVPVLIYFFVVDLTYNANVIKDTCSIDENYRVPCGKVNASESECVKLDCCYDLNAGLCYHYFPSRYNYLLNDDEKYETTKPVAPFFDKTLSYLKITVRETASDELQIIFHDPDEPIPPITHDQSKIYYTETKGNYLGIEVFRKIGNGVKIFSTRLGPLIVSDTFTEFTFNLYSDFLSGLGQPYIRNGTIKNKVVYRSKYDHSTLPVFMGKNNGYHGLSIENDGPLEFTILKSNLITVRSLAMKKIVFNLYLGQTPRDVRKKFVPSIELPPYWVLGSHICRDGKTDFETALEEVKLFYKNGFHGKYDSDCFHETLFSILHEISDQIPLREAIQKIKASNLQFMMSLPPQVPVNNTVFYNDAEARQILYKMSNTIFEGRYLKQGVVYPDFSLQKTEEFVDLILSDPIISQADSFTLKDNWPYEENIILTNASLSYLTNELASAMSNSIPWNSTSEASISHYKEHNSYGHNQEELIKKRSNNKFLMTSSSHLKSSNPLLVQNVDISWDNFIKSIETTLYQSIFGNPLISVPVCGSTSKFSSANEKLCSRWYMMTATMPLLRISSELPRRDPDSLTMNTYKDIATKALEFRKSMQLHYHTIISENEPIVRPMFYNYHKDNRTFNLTNQYMVGDGILVAQPSTPGATVIKFYLPPSEGFWFDYFTGTAFQPGFINRTFVYSDWIVFLAPGKIIPIRDANGSGLSLAITYGAKNSIAAGKLFVGNGYLNFKASNEEVTVENIDLVKIGCNDRSSPRPFFRSLSKLILYGHKGNFNNSTVIEKNFDICSASSQVVIPIN